MTTLIIAETRKIGVDWLTQNVPASENDDSRTQTSVRLKAGDLFFVVTKLDHAKAVGIRADQQYCGILVGTVSNELVEQIAAYWRGYRAAIEIIQGTGEVLTPTEMKRRKLIQQMADLDKEEALNNFVRGIDLNGIRVVKWNVHSDVNNRSFSISIEGRYT